MTKKAEKEKRIGFGRTRRALFWLHCIIQPNTKKYFKKKNKTENQRKKDKDTSKNFEKLQSTDVVISSFLDSQIEILKLKRERKRDE